MASATFAMIALYSSHLASAAGFCRRQSAVHPGLEFGNSRFCAALCHHRRCHRSVSASAAIHATLRFDPTWSTLRDTTRPIGLRFWPLPPPSRRSPFSVRNRDLLGWALDHPEFLPQFTQLAARNLNRLTAAGFLVSSAPAKFLQRFTHPLECNLVSVAIHATFLSPLRSA